jgi:N-acetylmuramoyl-L-alanine amidase
MNKIDFKLEEPFISIKHLPINNFSRTGKIRPETKIVDIHWVGNAGQHAESVARYFELLKEQNPHDEIKDRYASSNYIVGVEGEIIEIIPPDEISFTAGAATYTEFIKNKIGNNFTSNKALGTPNWCSVSIEICHPDWSGEFTEKTLEKTSFLVKALLLKYNLTEDDIVRHYDITGKLCPKWFVENEDEYKKFINRVKNVHFKLE